MELAPGKMVTETVRLVTVLGAGGMGSVWVADHLSLETQVAVKFVAKELLEQDDAILARFNREAALSAQIKSPHVVQIFDHGVGPEGTPFIVMELLEGEDLGSYIERRGPLGLGDTCTVVTQTAKALAKAHQLGIVHRDIKPDNLFLVEPEFDLFVKVLDFGVAKQTRMPDKSALTMTGAMVGTPEFMSPEQVLSAKGVDHRSDLWGLAVVAYYALTGQVPFSGETLGALCVAIATGEFRPVTELEPGLPSSLDGWFRRALAGAPEDRFQSARELAIAFAAAVGAAGVVTVSDPFSHAGVSAPGSLPPLVDIEPSPSDARRNIATSATEAKTLPSKISPTFAGASLTAKTPRRLSRAALWTVLVGGLGLGSVVGIWLARTHPSVATTAPGGAFPTGPPTERLGSAAATGDGSADEAPAASASAPPAEAGAAGAGADGGPTAAEPEQRSPQGPPKLVATSRPHRPSSAPAPPTAAPGEPTGEPTSHADEPLPELPPDRGF